MRSGARRALPSRTRRPGGSAVRIHAAVKRLSQRPVAEADRLRPEWRHEIDRAAQCPWPAIAASRADVWQSNLTRRGAPSGVHRRKIRPPRSAGPLGITRSRKLSPPPAGESDPAWVPAKGRIEGSDGLLEATSFRGDARRGPRQYEVGDAPCEQAMPTLFGPTTARPPRRDRNPLLVGPNHSVGAPRPHKILGAHAAVRCHFTGRDDPSWNRQPTVLRTRETRSSPIRSTARRRCAGSSSPRSGGFG